MTPLSPEDGWLLYHSVGRIPQQQDMLKTFFAAFADTWCAPGESRWEFLMEHRARFAASLASIMNVPDTAIMLGENVTSIFATFLDALPPDTLRGRQVLIAEDCFPSLHFLLSGLAARLGFELITVRRPASLAYVPDDAFLAQWDERVALAVVTWVTSTASHRADLHRMSAHGRRMNTLVTIDATQGMGIIPQDFAATDAALVATATMKWLCGVPGAAGGYVNPNLLGRLHPRILGWFSQPDPFSWNLDAFQIAPGMSRFDNGTPAFLCHAAAACGLEWIAHHGIATLHTHNQALAARLITIGQAHDLPLLGPAEADRRGGSIMLQLPERIVAADLARGLVASGLSLDARGQTLRLSPGVVTTLAACDALDRGLALALKRAA